GTQVPVPERYFEAARALDVAPDGGPPEFFLAPSARGHLKHWLTDIGLEQRLFAVIAPGAAHATKRWPTEHWQALTERLHQVGYGVVAVGGPADRELVSALGAHVINVAGEFTLQETGACLARAAVVVSGDTGVMHMATGVGTPVVALFGPTVEPFGFFPYTRRAAVLERDLGCRPCSAMGTARCPRRPSGRSPRRASTSKPRPPLPPRWCSASSPPRPGRCWALKPETPSPLPRAPRDCIYRSCHPPPAASKNVPRSTISSSASMRSVPAKSRATRFPPGSARSTNCSAVACGGAI